MHLKWLQPIINLLKGRPNIKKPLSLATTTKQENPVNTAQKLASQRSTKQNGEATREEVLGSIVTYTEEEIPSKTTWPLKTRKRVLRLQSS